MIKKSQLTKDTYKPGEFAKMLGCSTFTLYLRENEGKLKAYYTDTGRRFYKREDVIEELDKKGLLLVDEIKTDIVYGRVSTHKQKECGDLDRQISYILNQVALMNPVDLEVLSDVGSGLNDERKNFKKLLKKIMSGKINRVFILYKDRLTRIGFGQIETICKFFGTEIVVLSKNNGDETIEEESAEDIISIIHSFSEKLSCMRRKEVKSKIDEEFKEK